MRKLHRFHGGIHLADHKQDMLGRELQIASCPSRLYLPLRHQIGGKRQALVTVGERVLKGQLIATPASSTGVPIHASTSGTIAAIESHPVAHPSGQADTCVVIDVDGADQWVATPALDPQHLSVKAMLECLHDAGIVGLGGAAFPTSAKLVHAAAKKVDTLIINGAECEPYISCDEILMRRYAAEVVRGVAYLQKIVAPAETLIAIEDNKADAIQAMAAALTQNPLLDTEVVSIPTLYPSGGEKQLIQILTGKEVAAGQLPFDLGLFCQNVGTCGAITQALELGKPLISRIVTLAGDNISEPGNWEVLLGTPIEHLVTLAGGYKAASKTPLVMGGPMMGFALPSARVPIVKASNCILVMRDETWVHSPAQHDECIRCGNCTEVCPASLLPQQLYWHTRAKSYPRSQEFHLFDCIECGCCAAVCPSQIPLVQYYRAAKSEIRAAQTEQIKSDHARARFEFRQQRLQRKQQQDAERRRLKREALQQKKTGNADKPDPVQAALARVKLRKKTRLEEPR